VVRHLRLEFQDLPASFDGFRILHLSDLHIDGMDGLAEIVADRIAGLNADLCVMTGDYRFELVGPCDGVYPRLRTILSRVQSRHGVVAVMGNHDESEMAGEIEKLGVRMLINEAIEIRRAGASLWVVGVDDPHCYGFDDSTVLWRVCQRMLSRSYLPTRPKYLTRPRRQESIFVFAATFTPGRSACR
jgi:hypothetical protein